MRKSIPLMMVFLLTGACNCNESAPPAGADQPSSKGAAPSAQEQAEESPSQPSNGTSVHYDFNIDAEKYGHYQGVIEHAYVVDYGDGTDLVLSQSERPDVERCNVRQESDEVLLTGIELPLDRGEHKLEHTEDGPELLIGVASHQGNAKRGGPHTIAGKLQITQSTPAKVAGDLDLTIRVPGGNDDIGTLRGHFSGARQACEE